MTTTSWPAELPVVFTVRCASCEAPLELACGGLGGTVLYETYNEFACPVCRKQNHARTPGHILAVRRVEESA